MLIKFDIGFITGTGFVLDKDDHSITRSDFYFRQLFSKCGLHICKTRVCPQKRNKAMNK